MYWNIAQTLRVRFGKEEESLKWYKKILTETSRDAMGLVTKQVIAEIEGKTVEQVEQEIEEMIARFRLALDDTWAHVRGEGLAAAE